MIVKVCGITNRDDAAYALDNGADWIGVNLVAGPRRIDLDSAGRILLSMDDPARVIVLIGVDQGSIPETTVATLRDHGVRRLQLYGDVTPKTLGDIARKGFETILPWPIGGDESLPALRDFVTSCRDTRPTYLLLDAAVKGRLGGTGRRADWNAIARARRDGRLGPEPAVLLAGGLNPTNVAEAIRLIAPDGVDVSSGVEAAPGRKDHARIKAFIAAARGSAAERKARTD